MKSILTSELHVALPLCVLLSGACASPVVDTHFSGVVRDATSGEPIEGVEVVMEKRVCQVGDDICLSWGTEITAGPVTTAADGSYSIVAPTEDDIGGLAFRHDAYEFGLEEPWDESFESTVNEHEVELVRRAPVGVGALLLEETATEPGFELVFRELEPGFQDWVLILRAPGSGSTGAPADETFYEAGATLEDAVVVFAGPLGDPALETTSDGNHHFIDEGADPSSTIEYSLYVHTSIGIYGDPVRATWTP